MKKLIPIFILLCSSAVVYAQVPGAPDSSFGTDGRVNWKTTSSNDIDVYGMTILPDDRILISGRVGGGVNDDNLLLSMFKTDGDADSSFGNAGTGIYDPMLGLDETAINVDYAGGKIYMTGWQNGPNDRDVLLMRFDSDGTIDNAWGNNGVVTVHIAGDDMGQKVKVLPNNQILVGGTIYTNNNADMFLLRFNSDGTLDNTFSNAGKRIINFPNNADIFYDFDFLSSGAVIVVGATSDANIVSMGAAKVNTVGDIVPTFGTGARFKFAKGNVNTQARAVKVDDKDRIIIAGYNEPSNTNYDGVLIRIDSNGNFDSNFGTAGVTSFTIGANTQEYFNTLAIMNDGKIHAAGMHLDGNTNRFGLSALFDTSGVIDNNFGHLLIAPSANTTITRVDFFGMQSTGKMVLGGTSESTLNNDDLIFLVRLFDYTPIPSGVPKVLYLNSDVQMYPNPVVDGFRLNTKNDIKEVRMYDAMGRLAEKWEGKNAEYHISSTIASGNYFLQVYTSAGIEVKQIFIRR